MTWYILIGVIALLFILLIFYYNAFVNIRNMIEESWSGIDVQLKRRHDLIPNLVETVKGYASHEKQIFTQVTEARAMAISAQNVPEQSRAENMLSGALKSLFAVSESYPELAANQNFIQLQETLNEIEDTIQKARRYYNAVVRDNNTKVEAFPSVIVARMFGFHKKDYFEIDEGERQNVSISFP